MKGEDDMAGTREYEDLNKNLEMVDGHAVKAPEDYQDPEELYQALIARVRKYHPSADITMIEKAYQIGKEAHKDQFRKSGEPYIIHPLWVAIILADLEMDKETIVAGMLHDVVEDTTMTLDEISAEFGEEVALLVDGVTKLGQLNYSKDKLEAQAEDFKDFLANVKEGDLKSEYLLPNIVDKLLKEKRANVKVLETQDRWFGVTYKEDKEIVQKAFAELIQNGIYAEKLWE